MLEDGRRSCAWGYWSDFTLRALAPLKSELVSPDHYLVFFLEVPQWLVWRLGVSMALAS